MLSIILGIFGSGGFGSLVGLIGGYFNRKLDLENKKLDLEDHSKQREFELKKQDKDLEFAKTEYANKIQISTIEADAVVEQAGYKAMQDSYNFAAPTPTDGWVDKASKLVRPILTILFLVFTGVIFYQVQLLVNKLVITPTPEQILELYKMIIEWVIFQAGVCIGWWFAMRPGKQSSTIRKV